MAVDESGVVCGLKQIIKLFQHQLKFSNNSWFKQLINPVNATMIDLVNVESNHLGSDKVGANSSDLTQFPWSFKLHLSGTTSCGIFTALCSLLLSVLFFTNARPHVISFAQTYCCLAFECSSNKLPKTIRLLSSILQRYSLSIYVKNKDVVRMLLLCFIISTSGLILSQIPSSLARDPKTDSLITRPLQNQHHPRFLGKTFNSLKFIILAKQLDCLPI